MLAPARRVALLDRYAAGPRRLLAAFEDVPDAARQWRPAPDAWSAHEIVVHCGDSETTSASRIRYLLAEREVQIVGYDQDRWATTFDYHALPLAPCFAAIEAVRAMTAPLLAGLADAAWERAGRHSESGRYGVEDWLLIYAEHLELHARQLEANVAAWHAAQHTTAAPARG